MKKRCLDLKEDEEVEDEDYDINDATNEFTRDYNETAKILQEHAENAPNDLKEEDQRISKQARYSQKQTRLEREFDKRSNKQSIKIENLKRKVAELETEIYDL